MSSVYITTDIAELQRRFLTDFRELLRDESSRSPRKRWVALSGGIDSLLILNAAVELWGRDKVEAFTVEVLDTEDVRMAKATAKYYRVRHTIVRSTLDDMFTRIPSMKGWKMRTVFDAIWFVCFQKAIEEIDVQSCDAMNGDGADAIWGSTGPYTYLTSVKQFLAEGHSRDEARRLAKIKKRQDRQAHPNRGTARLFGGLVEQHGGRAIMPFDKTGRIEWVVELPDRIMQPATKGFLKDALRRFSGVPESVLRRKREMMQGGTGVYPLFQKELVAAYPDLGSHPNTIVRRLSE